LRGREDRDVEKPRHEENPASDPPPD
jgi:hypothetical protein